MKKIPKQEKGITLIALVLTIIVLIILAGITISTLIGDNGILTMALEAREKTKIEGIKEMCKTDILGVQATNNGNITDIQLQKILTKYFKEVPETLPKDLETLILTTKEEYGKHEIKISEIYQMSGNIILTANDIADNPNKVAYYGATVTGYTCANALGINAWKIFYADKNNIYLIADEYISSQYIPKARNGTSLKVVDTYKSDLGSIVNDYSGSEDITDVKIQALNNNYFNYLTENNQISTNLNMKAVAYLLDKDVWSGFQGPMAEYAIGGPTIEIYLKSHNEKYHTDYQAQTNNINGYTISNDGGATWKENGVGILSQHDNLYIYRNDISLFLASPSAAGTSVVMRLGTDWKMWGSYLGATHYARISSFRLLKF